MPTLHKLAGFLIVCAVVLGLTLPGARRDEKPPADAARAAQRGKASPGVTATARPAGAATPSATPTGPVKIGAASPAAVSAKANELGEIPVLMYHRIMKKTELSLDRSVTEFRNEVTRLAKEGYVPITAAELVSGRIDVPLGKHPVVLTFDDSTPGHFGLDAQGRPKPDTAVAILMEVAAKFPGFRPVATFYLNDDLFGMGDQAGAGLKWLQQHGFDLGNHTVSHPDLSQLSQKEVQKEIGGMESKIFSLTGTHAATLAYPFGSVPEKRSWAQKKDGEYDFKGVLLAGWKPSGSPFDKDFDPFAILRVRSEGKISENDCREFCSIAWLDKLNKDPDTRYTSDGDPNTISFRASDERLLAKKYRPFGRSY
ncbi:polysaccharide deacetylase family protein [Actinomadura rudentiformis]|uniref:Polysaccharide deacetylase family protein n=1 Tax=Actinomadura rudentiformis TaxID=359158 RepID=A0A6H9YR65_9ACTN|nr:polysaccharide deacetylase family protein [Actinomadura rudentiformis]KAB2342714.1 polysaccharide deacetylase family protein [Actinomadura rudentiformis]